MSQTPSQTGGEPDHRSGSGDLFDRLRRLVAGDRDAAGWLYDTFAPSLLRRLRHRYGPLGFDPEDLLQDAFAFYFRNDGKVLQDFVDRAGPEPVPAPEAHQALLRHLWDLACGVASNARRAARSRPVVPLADHLPFAGVTSGVERTAVARDTLRRLEACLRRGNRRVALYYALRFRDGLTPAEVVRATGWSNKATYKLRQSLNEAVRRCAETLGIELG